MVVVVALGVVGVVAACVIAARGGSRYLSPRSWGDRAGVASGFGRSVAIGILGGAAAGVLVGGLGGRLVMRILAATSGDAAQGQLTDAEERVGEVTAGGTIGLILFVGVGLGIFGGLLFVAVRRWLPRRAWAAGLLFGVLVLVLLAPLDPLSRSNHDFRILRPVGLAIVLVAALFPLYGLTVAGLIAWLDSAYPDANGHAWVVLPVVVLLLAPPAALATAVVGAIAYALHRDDGSWRSNRVTAIGQAALALAVVVGGTSFAFTIADLARS